MESVKNATIAQAIEIFTEICYTPFQKPSPMRDVSPILRSLGFTDSEIKTYLAGLEKGPQTVIELTKVTGLSRQAVYLAIDALTERGLMSSVLRGKKNIYVSESPETLLNYSKRKEAELKAQLQKLEEVLPELRLASGGEKPVVKTYEGKDGIFAMLNELQISNVRELHEITDLVTMKKIFSFEDLRSLKEKVAQKNARVYGIYSGPVRFDVVKNKLVCELPETYSNFKGNISVNGNKSALVSFSGKMHSVIIENKAIADTLRILIELAQRSCRQESSKKK